MKNKFEVDPAGFVRIFLPGKLGLTMLIDAADLPIAQAVKNTISGLSGWTAKTFYAVFREPNTKWHRFHRRLMACPDHLQVDHLNHDGLDNRRDNLRIASATLNMLNRSGPSRHNKTSGIRGVHLHRASGKWRAQIGFRGKLISLGLFSDWQQAKAVFDAKLAELEQIA